MGLALQPDIVRAEALEGDLVCPPAVQQRPGNSEGECAALLEEITENGALGDARHASEAFGHELKDAVVRHSVEFLERFLSE